MERSEKRSEEGKGKGEREGVGVGRVITDPRDLRGYIFRKESNSQWNVIAASWPTAIR